MADEDRGPLIAELSDGTQIYRNGILKSDAFFEVRFLNMRFETTFDPNIGAWSGLDQQDAQLIVPRGGPTNVELSLDDAGHLYIKGGQIGASLGAFEAALVYNEFGEVDHFLLGAGVDTRLGGISAGFRIRDNGDNLSSYNTITVMPNGQIIEISHSPGDAQYPNVKVRYAIYDADGALTTEGFTNIADAALAADMAAGIAPRDNSNQCFLADTEISMWDGTKKPIEEITPEDEVVSYDKDGNLVPGRVTRVFQHQAKHILDVFGLHVTPGHVTFCGDGEFEGKHVPIIDILRSDGALVRENGQKVRACTNEPLGTPKDNFVWAITGEKQPDGSVKVRDKGKIRLGTRYITEDGYDISVADLIFGADAMVSPEGLVIQKIGGQGVPFYWPFTKMLPKPENYILQRSALMLNEIYQSAEWEAVQPQMPAPVMGDLGPVQPANEAILQAMPPNVPLSMQGSPNQPKMNRKQRKAHEARRRKIAKRLHGQSTLH